MNCIDTKTPAGCDQQGRYETRDKPLPLLTRWGMWLSQWFNWKV